jgi:hypothetical protein
MKNAENVKVALIEAVYLALEEHLKEHGTLKNLDWFNASDKTTDFYAEQLQDVTAA